MKVTILGTGTSQGVPVMGCQCEVCRSLDPKDKRFRTSALIETESTRILIDCGPDVRQQLMPLEFRKIDGLLLTHEHYDHVGGLDDLRPYCKLGDIDIYANDITVKAVKHNFPYCFVENLYPGVPKLNMNTIEKGRKFTIGDIEIEPIEVMHDKLPILGYRFWQIPASGSNLSSLIAQPSIAYITDMKSISQEEADRLRGVETLVVNALRWEKPHHSHMLVQDAIDFARSVGAQKVFLTHLTHKIGLHAEAEKRLPEGFHFAYDGQVIML